MIARTYCGCFNFILMKEVFIACTLLWIPFILLGIAAFIKILRWNNESRKDKSNPFEESDKFIEQTKESFFEFLEEKESIIRERADLF